MFLFVLLFFSFIINSSFAVVFYENKKIPGFAFSIIKDGKVVERKLGGYEDFDKYSVRKINKNNSFEINSMSKQFTAAAILLLEEKNLLSLEDPITKYIQDLPKSFSKIKIINLITHTAGLSDYLNDFDLEEKLSKGEKVTNNIVKKYTISAGINQKNLKNLKYSYSNSGYVLLSEIVENISKMRFEEFLKISIFDKLEMKNSFIMDDNRVDKNCLSGHSSWPFFIEKNRDSVLYTTGDRGVCTSIGDYVKWLIAIDDGIIFDKKETSEKFTNLVKINGKLSSSEVTTGKNIISYGYGWRHGILKDKYLAMFHRGHVRGLDSFAVKLIEYDMWIIFFSSVDIGESLDLMYDIIDSEIKKLKN